MTSLKRNKALNIRTIANYLKEGSGGGGESFDSFSQPLPPKIVSATLVLRRNIQGIPIQSLVWCGKEWREANQKKNKLHVYKLLFEVIIITVG